MTELSRFSGRLAPLPIDNVDTDQIIPASYLKVTDKSGLGEGLFSRWRRDEDGAPRSDFVLNRPEFDGATILLAGENFGCGSSREHAPWALLDFGFRAVISTRFADIFSNNALKNGLLLVPVEPQVHARLMRRVEEDPATEVTIDLEQQTLHLPDGESVGFSIDRFAKECLIRGVDQLGYLLDLTASVDAFEQSHTARVDTRGGA